MNSDLVREYGNWPYLPTLLRILLAGGLGLFVGLERERRGKEAGVRTFAFASLLGCVGGLVGDTYALATMGLLVPFVIFLNIHALKKEVDTEMTTSAALLLMGFIGILCGKGHTFTPVALGLMTAGLLAWKTPLSGFSIGITETELRSAILLGIIAFIIYPILPDAPIDQWGLIVPRTVWTTVILIASMGFANYILLKIYGSRGSSIAAFLAGLVNSTVAVAELATRTGSQGTFRQLAFRGTMLATGAMILRNAVLLTLVAPACLPYAGVPFVLMLFASLITACFARGFPEKATTQETIKLDSPFSLKQALKFGILFLVLSVGSVIAQRALGRPGFYGVSILGGLVSSASSVASAGQLAKHGDLPIIIASFGAILASLASASINIPLFWRVDDDKRLFRSITLAVGIVVATGFLSLLIVEPLGSWLQHHLT